MADILIVAFILFVSLSHLPPPAGSVFFNFSTFNQENQKDIRIKGNASFSVGLIDISANRYTGIGNSSGRVSYAHPVPLWDSTTGGVASFTTGFSFAIPLTIKDTNNKGNGMAFFLASYPSSLPAGRSPGYNLGLTNQSAGAVASGNSRFVAVEFDTFNDTEVSDPNTTYDHLGIDVNSLISVNTSSLPSFSLSGSMNATIEYDNVSSILAMTLWLGDGRDENYSLSSEVDLKSALPEQVAVGFSASTGASMELHQLFSWYFNSSLELEASPSPRSSSARYRRVIAEATSGAALFILLCVAVALLIRRGRHSKKKIDEEGMGSEDDDGEPITDIEMGTGPRRFPYHELLDATRNFAPEEKLGQGGFGAVYRGHLREHGLVVAIKRFSKESSMQGRKEYKSEIRVISSVHY